MTVIFLAIVDLQDLPCVVKWFWPEEKPDKEESEEEKEKDSMEDADDEEEEEDEPEVCCKKSVSALIMLFTSRRVYFRFLDSAI